MPIYDKFFKALGAQPVRMAPPAVHTALERKTVDGYGWPLWGVNDFGWDKFTKYRHGPGFFSAVVNILVNLDRWNAMADEQRQCLTDMAGWLESEWPKWRAAEDQKQTAAQLPGSEQAVEAYMEDATRRVKLGLILAEVVKTASIQPDADKVRQRVESMSKDYEDPGEFVRYYQSNPQLLRGIETLVMEDMVVDWIVDQADVAETERSFDDLMNTAT